MFRKFILLIAICYANLSQGQVAQNGIADLTDWDLKSNPTLRLDGSWNFYPLEFINPTNLSKSGDARPIEVPIRWDQSDQFPAQGFGTYELIIIKNTNVPLALRIPDIFSAYSLFVNGNLLTSVGVPGKSVSSSIPGRQTKLVSLREIKSDTLHLVIHLSNFVHNKGGIGKSLTIGADEALIKKKFFLDIYDVFLTGCLVMGGFFFIGLFVYGKKEKMALFFALFCIAYAYRIIGTGNYLLHEIVPMPYRVGIILEFASLYLSVYFFSRYILYLFPKESPKKLLNIFSSFSLIWLLVLFLPVSVLARVNVVYLIGTLFLIGIVCIVFIRALINRRMGAYYSIFSTIGVLLVFAMKGMDYFGIMEEIVLVSAFGQLIFFLFQSLILSKHFSDSWRKANKASEKAIQAKSDFLSVMSHEIRTPLNAVIGTTYHLMDDNPRTDQLDKLRILKNSSENLLALINNVLDFSKIDAGKVEFEEVDTELKTFCSDVLNMMSPIADQKELSLQLDYDDNLPPILRIDTIRVSQILTNLLSNAIKFTKSGHVKLSVSQEATDGINIKVKFSVEDTGIGLDKNTQQYIFESFQQANNSVSRQYGGTGLGLTITKRLIEMMGSEISVESRLGVGSTFEFTLSLNKGDKEVLKVTLEENFDLEGSDVLLVEDNAMNVVIAKRLLDKWKINVTVAENGLQALSKVDKANFDLILMDLQMPEMDGYEATRILRREGFKRPILALTASPLEEEIARLKDLGLSGIISKPYNPKKLYETISEHLAISKASY